MTGYLSLVFFVIATFLMVSNAVTPYRQFPVGEVLLVKEPDDKYYLAKKTSVVIICQAKNAAEIVYVCTGTQIPETSVEIQDVSNIDPSLIQAKIDVTRADVQNYEGDGPFWCTCSAVDSRGQVKVTSRKGYVYVAYLNSKFATHPASTRATIGENVEFMCQAPEGDPIPKIMWKKDSRRADMDGNPRIFTTDKGSLVIKSVTKKDSGMYRCIARSIAGRRESEGAYLTITALEESAEPSLVVSPVQGISPEDDGKAMATQQSMKTYFTTEPLETYYITEDKPLLIDCAVVSADIFTWRCNSKRMEKERQTVIQGLDSAGNRNIQSQLKITYSDVQVFHAEVGDSSTYQCICIAWFQDSSTPGGWGRLDSQPEFGFVKLAYLNSTFRNEPSDIIANLNTDVTLACEPPRGQPDPAVYWHKDGKRLDSHRIYTMNSLGHLTIHKVQQNDEGTYTCIAVNAAKAAQSRSASLTINSDLAASTTTSLPSIDFPEVIPSTPVFFIDFQSEYTLEKDGTKAMVCAVMSAEQMTIECGGKRLATEEYDLQSKVHRDSGKRLLVVKTVVTAEKVAKMPDDYFCQCTAWFLNEQRAWKNLLSSKGYVRSTARSVYIRDQFQIIPVDVYANFQAEERIECNPPEGYPSPTVYWLKDGTRIYSDQDPNFVILTEGTLVIEYVRVIDEGKYVCVAENEAGIRSSHPVQLTVIGKPEQTIATTEMIKPDITTHTPEDTTTIDPYITTLTEPVFSEELNKEYYIIKGQPVTLECTVIAAKQLLFVCNGEVLTETSLTDVNYLYPENQFYSRKNSLVVTKVEVEKHTGSKPYTCACRAYYHKKDDDPPQLKYVDSSPAVIQVPYMSNHFEQEPSDTEVTYLGSAELSCKAPNGAPQPEVHWLKNGFRILQSERIKIESSGNLVINKFYAEDVGAYTCVAENFVRSRPSRTANVSLADEKVTKSDNEPNTVQPEPETTVTGIDSSVYYPSAPYISKDLQEVYYLIDNKPTIISCEAYDVELITFICGMQTVEDPEVKARAETVVLKNGSIQIVKVTEALVQVSKKEVENYSPGNEYWCQCHANFRVIDSEVYQQISSIKGVVKIADHEGSTCGQMLADCDKLFLFGNDLDLCAAFPEYTTCMDDFINKCAGIVDENTMRNANMTYIDTQRKCFLEPKCPELENCKRVPSNSPSSGLTVQNFCSDGSNLVQCIDSALAACNVRLTPTEEKLKESLFAVVNWFTNFCKRMILGSESLTSCEKMKTCDTYIGQLAADNATSWCRLMSSLVECTNDAVNVCQMDELRNDLEHLHSEARYIYCSKDDYEETNGYLEPVITPVEPSRESKQEGDAEPKSETAKDNNGSTMLCTSVLLTAILQLLIMIIQPLR
uniref:Ig-like domain-containing protein n=1 Tax=Arion vulgaris TaxID=1028688 RepID=A0A0B6ZQM5_9EUPU